MQSFIHTTDNGNLYLYYDQSRLSFLIHPEFERACKNETDVDLYYLKKYAYFIDHGFFDSQMITDFRKLEESEVVDNIFNTKQIVFEVTDSCNLNCTYCSLGELYEGYDERIEKKINTRYAINLLKYIFDIKPKNKNSRLFISFYGGEALLNMNFIKRIIEISKKLNEDKEFDLVYTMTTNATLIDRHIKFLYENKFKLLISLDGNEVNHSYRVLKKNNKNSFQKVIQNIDMIQKNYPEYFSSHVNFNAVLHNKNSVKEIYEFIYKRYNKIPRISELNTRDIRSDNESIIETMYHNRWKSEVEFQEEKSELSHITHSELVLFSELTNFLKYTSVNYYISNINALFHIKEKYLPSCTCTPFSKKFFLTNRNKLLPCEKISYNYSMGRVEENIEIDIPEITRRYNNYYDKLLNSCKSCYAYRFCSVCLFVLKNIEIETDKFVCERYQDQKEFKNKLNRIFSFLEQYPTDFAEILENVILE